MIKAVFFDFDGTIADTFPIVLKTANALLREMGKEEINNPERFRSLSALQLIRASGIPLWKLPFLRQKALSMMANEMQEAQVFPGMAEAMRQLREHYFVGIITSNEQETVETVLRKHKIGCDLVITGSSIFGKSKDIMSALRKQHLTSREAVYVGDEVRDVDASRAAGVRVISVTWGFNSKEALKKAKPDAIADNPSELLKAIKKLNTKS